MALPNQPLDKTIMDVEPYDGLVEAFGKMAMSEEGKAALRKEYGPDVVNEEYSAYCMKTRPLRPDDAKGRELLEFFLGIAVFDNILITLTFNFEEFFKSLDCLGLKFIAYQFRDNLGFEKPKHKLNLLTHQMQRKRIQKHHK
jgi:hypothetical protein